MIKRLALILSFLVLLSSQGFSDQTDLYKVRINDFSGGQNSYDLPDLLNPNQGELYKNVVISRKGRLSKRKGQFLFATDEGSTAFTGMGVYNPDPNTSYLIVASGSKVVSSLVSPATYTVINPSNLLTAGKDTEFIQANNYLFTLNGYDNTSWWNGSTWNPGAGAGITPPVAKTGAWLRNYLFTAGDPQHPDWLTFSNNLIPTNYTASDVVKVNTGDGQAIIKLEPFRMNELIVYKEKSVFDLDITGVPLGNWTCQPITTAIGLAAQKSVVNIGNDHWFLSSEPFALRSLARTSYDKILVQMISQPIQDIFDGTGDTTINKTYISKACAVLFDNKYFLAIPTGTSSVNNLVCVFDFVTNSWYLIDGWYPASWAVFKNKLYYTDALDARIIQCFAANYNDMASGPVVTSSSEPSQPISFDYISKAIDFDNPNNFKQPDALECEFRSVGNYTSKVYLNQDSKGWQFVGNVTMNSTSPTLPADLPIVLSSDNIARKIFQTQKFGEFKKMQIRIIQDGGNQTCDLHSFTVFGKLKDWRRE